MHDVSPMPRFPRAKFLATLLLLLAAGPALVAFWINHVSTVRETAMEQKLAALRAEIDAIDLETAQLRKGTDPGDAWNDYLKALGEAGRIQDISLLTKFIERKPGVGRDALEFILKTHAVITDHLRQGAGRAECRILEAGFNSPRGLSHLSTTAFFSVAKARTLAQEGQLQASTDMLLDLCQFLKSVANTSAEGLEPLCLAKMNLAFAEIAEILKSPGLAKPVLETLKSRLADLDLGFIRHDRSLLLEVLDFPTHFRDVEIPFRTRLGAWRYGCSSRFLQAEVFDRSERYARDLIRIDSVPWSQVPTEARRVIAEQDSKPEPALECFGWGTPTYFYAWVPGRYARTHLRLLQVAVHHRLTGEVLELDNPFGGKIRHKQESQRDLYWSNSVDGVDYGGVGDWGDLHTPRAKDIVLEIPR